MFKTLQFSTEQCECGALITFDPVFSKTPGAGEIAPSGASPNLPAKDSYVISFSQEISVPSGQTSVDLSPASYMISNNSIFAPQVSAKISSFHTGKPEALIRMTIKDVYGNQLYTDYVQINCLAQNIENCVARDPDAQQYIRLNRDNNWTYKVKDQTVIQFIKEFDNDEIEIVFEAKHKSIYAGRSGVPKVAMVKINDNVALITPTPTPTPTRTVTPTPTRTVTPTPTPTVTPTPTATTTPTVTPTRTPAPSVTPTVTPTTSITPSLTPTQTPTPSPSMMPFDGLYAWGKNTYNPAGNIWGDEIRNTPTLINYDQPTLISAGDLHTLKLQNGIPYSCGSNTAGQLGLGNTSDASYWVIIQADVWTSLSAGLAYSLGIKAGKLYAWGLNDWMQLGDTTRNNRNIPTLINNGSWSGVYAGKGNFSAAISGNGNLYYWGSGSYGYPINRSSPTLIGSGVWKDASFGTSHILAISGDGSLYAAGANDFGQLGDGTNVGKNVLTKIAGGSWKKISAGYHYSLAISGDGSLYAWGYNEKGSLGDETYISKSLPVLINSGSWSGIVCSYGAYNRSGYTLESESDSYNLAVSGNGDVYAWGNNQVGQLGDGTLISTIKPKRIASGGWTQIGAGAKYSIAITDRY